MFASALLPSRIYHMVMAHPSSHSAWSQRSPQPRAVSSLHKHCLDRTYGTLLFVTYSWPCLETRRRQWHRTPVLLPGKSHGRRRLVGCSPWSREESDTTEQLHFHTLLSCTGRRKWQPTPVFLPGESQGRWSLVGCRLWGRTELDTTEAT